VLVRHAVRRRLRTVAPPRLIRIAVRRAQPAAVAITRLVATAVAAYLMALRLLDEPAPVLAPLTALLVVQVSLLQTLRSGVQRIVSVTAGVIVAVVLVDLVGFTWWSLGATVAAALALGHLLRLGDHMLEVPISAMLILQLGSETAALDRIVETLIGAGVGMTAGLLTSPVRVRPAAEAVAELGRSMGTLLEHMADGLAVEPDRRTADRWLHRSRELARQIREVDRALTEAEDSARLNPRTRVGSAGRAGPVLRTALEHLEHAAVSIRGLARSMADRTALVHADRAGLGAAMWEADVRDRLAAALRELSRGTDLYTRAVTAATAADAARCTGDLASRLSRARRRRDDLGGLLREDSGHWPLHGELLVHLDRLIDELHAAGRGPLAHRSARRRPVIRRSVLRIPRAPRPPTRPLMRRRRRAAAAASRRR